MKKIKGKSCKWEGCKTIIERGVYCDEHRKIKKSAVVESKKVKTVDKVETQEKLDTEFIDPQENVPKMNHVQCLELSELELKAELSKKTLSLTLVELRELDRNYNELKRVKLAEKVELERLVEQNQKNYEAYVRQLAHSFGLDPTKMTYNTTTGLLRDLREKSSDSSHDLPN
jgi:transcriptional regulator of aromatic amino acid metabolism